ncbi:uncharacterized protein LOC119770063 isoform X3 [Culex quinquefasciatus]|nr:uncharacterized protein LOC119770063 isoform X3 [Culex quinquefasciatus]
MAKHRQPRLRPDVSAEIEVKRTANHEISFPRRTRRHASAVSKDEPDLKRTREAELESEGGRRDASHAKNHKRLRVTTHTRTTEARFSVKVTPTRKQV